MPLRSSSEAPVINPGPRRSSRTLCAAQGDAGRQHGNRPEISVGICYSAGAALGLSEDWSAAAGLRARVFRGVRHLIRLLIDTVLDSRTIPAQSLQELDNPGDFCSLRIASSNVRKSR
jgi:hypothetical protein